VVERGRFAVGDGRECRREAETAKLVTSGSPERLDRRRREDRLRGKQISAGFIERRIDRVLFYDAPTWVFTAAYVIFAAVVTITWIAVPPTRTPRKR
jgi:Protein of Unknown function (DUF2784)